MSIPVLVTLFSGHQRTLSLSLDPSTPLASLPDLLSSYVPKQQQTLSTFSGRPLAIAEGDIASIYEGGPVLLRLGVRLCGGKGGFGSQLRAAGGRMSGRKGEDNNDSCRDLNGRRLSSVKEAERLKKYLEEAPGRELERKKQLKEKLENLNKEIERIDGQMVASTSARPLPEGEKLVEQEKVIVGVKRKAGAQEDKYLEESKEIVGNVRSAVQAAMLKKRKKNAASAAPATVEADPKGKSKAIAVA